MFSLMWSEHCSYKHSRALAERRFPTEGEHVLQGPGENAGIVDDRARESAMRSEDREPQPPLGGRAVRGRRDRRGRHRARHPGHGRAPDRAARLTALRIAGRAPAAATCSRARSRASGTTATASACRPSAARWPSTSATRTRAWSTRCASAWFRPPIESCARPRQGPGNGGGPHRQPHRPRRHRGRERVWPRRSSPRRRTSADRPSR